MESLPRAGSSRRQAAVGFWVVFTLVFVGLFVYGIFRWERGEADLPWLAIVGGIGALIGVWRWIAGRTSNLVE